MSASNETTLRCYFIRKCDFVNPKPTLEQLNDIKAVSDKYFLQKATSHTLNIYQSIIDQVLVRTGPVIEMYGVPDSREHRLVIGFRHHTTQGFFSSMSDLYHFYQLYTSRKYVEQFSNGVTICSFYLNQMPNSTSIPIESSIYQVMKEASLIYCLPTTSLQMFFQTGELSIQEVIYAHVGWIFAQHFLNRLGRDFKLLSSIVDLQNINHAEIVGKIKKRLRSDTFTREYILDIIKLYPELVKLCYLHFAVRHHISNIEEGLKFAFLM